MNKRQRTAILMGMAALVVYAVLFAPQHKTYVPASGSVIQRLLVGTERGSLFSADFGVWDEFEKDKARVVVTRLAVERLLVEMGFVVLLTAGAVLVLSSKQDTPGPTVHAGT